MWFSKKKKEAEIAGEQKVEEKGIYVLGSGCKLCNNLTSNVKEALNKLQSDEEVFHITDFAVIASYGIMTTPALIIDKKVVSTGKVLSADEVAELLKKVRG